MGALVLIALLPAERVTEIASLRVGEALAFGVTWTAFAIVGAIVVRHQPDNLVGWLCSVTGLQVALVALAVGIGTYNLAADPRSRVGLVAAWLSHAAAIAIISAPLFILLRFPTGRSLGPWWHRAERLLLVFIGGFVVLAAVEPMPLFGFPTTPNPFALGETARLGTLGFALLVAPLVAAVAGSLVVRYRHGSLVERRQLRWLAVASALVGGALVSMQLTSPELATGGRLSPLSSAINAIAFASIPVAIGIAIVRDRLYDIDRILNRTLVYAVVSAVLGGVYVAAVLGLSAPLSALSASTGSTLATAGSTLLVAALFRPVRARAQVAINRRFDRERYEAARMIEAFAGQVRSEVELDAIVGDLRIAAARTVHPSTTSCWIRARPPASRALVGSAGQR